MVTAGCCLVFVKLWGLVGAPVGTTVGACLVSLPLNLRIIGQDTDTSIPELLRGMLGGWFWRFLLMIAGATFVALRWPGRLGGGCDLWSGYASQPVACALGKLRAAADGVLSRPIRGAANEILSVNPGLEWMV